jgi:hypothetical protein
LKMCIGYNYMLHRKRVIRNVEIIYVERSGNDLMIQKWELLLWKLERYLVMYSRPTSVL